MVPKSYVKFEVPKDLKSKILQVMEISRNSGKIKKGMNETTKAIERGIAQFVVIAEDVDPEEIVMHLPVLCEEKKIPYGYVSSKQELGRAVGIDVACAAACIVDPGEAKDDLKEIIDKLNSLKG
ncbi:MAG: 50S ribosomal protein L7Ae [Candidatus Aenigmatarchaeota archaeon]